jgi:predicted DNA-binding WGR domain protein
MKTRHLPQVHLEFCEGSSDKEYNASIVETTKGLYAVNFSYGRRGGTLKEGTKTEKPVCFPEAQAIFDDLVASKQKKGYA